MFVSIISISFVKFVLILVDIQWELPLKREFKRSCFSNSKKLIFYVHVVLENWIIALFTP
jgi:hypothetical protein